MSTPTIDHVYGLFILGTGSSNPQKGLFLSVEGAKAAAHAEHAGYLELAKGNTPEEDEMYEKTLPELVWEFKQTYFKVGRRELPNGAPCHVAQSGSMTSFEVRELPVLP